MSLGEFLTILAILLAPLVAIQGSLYLARKREKKERRRQVFNSLMATRASRLSLEHTRTLNMIDVEFYGKDKASKRVVQAWKVYLDHLEDKSLCESSLEAWISKGNDLFVDLLYQMAVSLDYEFEKVSIKKTSYFPVSYGQMEEEQKIIREGLSGVFTGKWSIPIRIVRQQGPK